MRGKRQVGIRSRRVAYKGRYSIEEVVFDFDRPTGKGRIADAKREIFERGDSAAALIYDIERDVVVLTEQFRIATFEKGPGYLIEAIAGSLDAGEDAETCLRREMMEEVGYKAGKLTLVAKAYVSPGASSERIFLYYAPVTTGDLVDPEASGVAADKEDIRRVEYTRDDFLIRLEKGRFQDGKIITLGYWLKSQPKQGRPSKGRGVKRARSGAKKRAG